MGNSCIGLLNHKFFILYLFYLSLSVLNIVLLFGGILIFDDKIGVLNLMERSMSEAAVFFTACAMLFAMGLMTVY